MPLLCNSHQRAWPQTGTRCWLSLSSSPPVVQHSSLFTLLTSLSSLGVHFAPLSLSLLTAWLMLSWLGLNQSVASSCHPVHRGGRSNLTLIKHPNHANVIKKKNALHRKHKPLSLMSCSLLILGSLFIIPQNSISMKFLNLMKGRVGCRSLGLFLLYNLRQTKSFVLTLLVHNGETLEFLDSNFKFEGLNSLSVQEWLRSKIDKLCFHLSLILIIHSWFTGSLLR